MTSEISHRRLGRTGVHVSPFALGAMMFGARGNTDRAACVRMVHTALDAGVNVIDTADAYSDGESEEIVGEALASGRRDDVVLATKAYFPMAGADVNARGSSRRWLTAAVDASLRRLRTDWIDVYQVHRHDPETDHDETLGALTDLVRAGKIRYAGTSTYPARALVEAQVVAERRGRERFATEQPPYSLLNRGIEADVLPVCRDYGIGVLAWSPLAGGWLTRRGRDVARSHRTDWVPELFELESDASRRKLQALERLHALADEAGIPLIELALAFVVNHPAVSCAIIGPRTPEQLAEQLPAMTRTLPVDVLDRIDAIVPPGTVFKAADFGWDNPALTREALRR
jgi:aryl-alcohol dehydrogenase-like predicted oxidoreductase